jgi:hypothetical protein
MSRISLIEQLYVKRKSALEFDYDALWAPPIRSILTQEDVNALYSIATSLRYNGNIEKKYELIDSIMRPRGFVKAHSGTNRVVYNFLELPTFVAKVAVDKVGMKDSPAEFRNQEYFKPFCCKIFEVDPTGVIAFVERVNPITSLEEFLSVSDDIFNMMITKIIGKYVVDDLGVNKYMNYGLRYNANGCTFGPVILDFPYAYELDGAKLICKKPIQTINGLEPCNGEIDYDKGLNGLFCTKCGREYKALDLKKHDSNIQLVYSTSDKKGANIKMRSRIVGPDGKTIMDSGFSSDVHITKEQYNALPVFLTSEGGGVQTVKVSKTKSKRYKDKEGIRREEYTRLQTEEYNRLQNAGAFNSVGSAFTAAEEITADEYVPSHINNIVVPVSESRDEPAPVEQDKPVEEANPLDDLDKEIIKCSHDAIDDLRQDNDIGTSVHFTIEAYGRYYYFEVEDGGPIVEPGEEVKIDIDASDIIQDIAQGVEEALNDVYPDDEEAEDEEPEEDINDSIPAVNPNKPYNNRRRNGKHNHDHYDDDDMSEY